MESPGIPIEELFPGAEYVPAGQGGKTMELAQLKERYIADKERAMGNAVLVEAELVRLKGVVLRLEGAIGAIQELEGGPSLTGGPAIPVSSPKEVPEGETEED